MPFVSFVLKIFFSLFPIVLFVSLVLKFFISLTLVPFVLFVEKKFFRLTSLLLLAILYSVKLDPPGNRFIRTRESVR